MRFDQSIFKHAPSLSENMAQHVAWIYENIYSQRLTTTAAAALEKYSDISRLVHGIQHVTRAASYLPMLVHMRRGLSQEDATHSIDERTLKLLQIAILLHDSGRDHEEE